MSSAGDESCPSEEVLAARGHLQKCLQMLKTARNDNDKMAALLLFTHLMKSHGSLRVDEKELFSAIGARFIVRLLNSKNVPAGCPEFMYQALAVNILASFTDQGILFDPSIIQNLPVIVDILSLDKSAKEVPDMVKDCAKIVLLFSRTKDGCKYLFENNFIHVIFKAVASDTEMDTLFDVIKGLLFHMPVEMWSYSGSELNSLLDSLAKTFAEFQDMSKFTACDELVVVLSSMQDSGIRDHENEIDSQSPWKKNIRKGLRDILQSKCKIEYKYSALYLAVNMVELCGLEWMFDSEGTILDMSNTKLWFVLLSVAKTEVKMFLDSGDQNVAQKNASVLVACYQVIEKTIEFLIVENSGRSFNDDLVLNIHAILVEVFGNIMQFLVHLGTSKSTCCFRMPIVRATIRALCAWLSEETNALSDGVAKVLPVLLHWARSSLEEGTEVLSAGQDCRTSDEILSCLLPPLCHLSADETFCGILIKEEAHVVLAKFFNQLWQTQQREQGGNSSSLIIACNVFLNFAVLEIELLKKSQVFQEILKCIMASLPEMIHSNNVTITAHFILLGLLLFRHRCPPNQTSLSDQETNFLLSSINFLKQAQISVCQAHQSDSGLPIVTEWENISELWFLSVQNIVACAKAVVPVKKVLVLSGWVEQTKVWLQTQDQNNEIFQELKQGLLPIVTFG